MDMDYIDIGVNLLDDSFKNDRDEVIDRAFNSNVRILINTSSSMEDSKHSLDFSKKVSIKNIHNSRSPSTQRFHWRQFTKRKSHTNASE
jgi:Tat protein secretion system quality control protein TatD with DNase activity